MTKNKIYKYFADLIYKASGIHYPETNYYQLDARMTALSKYMEVESLEALYDKFKSNSAPEALNYLIDLATNNETSFFRDKTPFKALPELADLVLPKSRVFPFEIWSAASSTGQESYSILMALKEKKPQVFDGPGVQILATDIKQMCLDRTKQGIYNHLEIQRGLPAPFLIKYFVKTPDEKWQAKDDLRKCVATKKLNLYADTYPVEHQDIIFCRNVLIYQTMENKKLILEKLISCLKPGGFLILGSSENLLGLSEAFERERVADSTCYRLKPASEIKSSRSA